MNHVKERKENIDPRRAANAAPLSPLASDHEHNCWLLACTEERPTIVPQLVVMELLLKVK